MPSQPVHSRPTPTQLAVLLAEYVMAYGRRTFNWGGANCCHFAAGWVAHVTGRWPMHGLPDTPTAREAVRLVRSLGGDLATAWTGQLGRPALAASFAQLGDVVLTQLPPGHAEGLGQAVGVCNGWDALFMDPAGHSVHLPMWACTHAWRLWPDPVAGGSA
jgi:hypothetical protein